MDEEEDEFGIVGIRIVTPEEAASADYIVCTTKGMATPFDDNIEAACGLCGTTVIHRPHVPEGPMKICIFCVVSMSEATSQ